MSDRTVTTRQYRALLDAIRALADAGDEALARLAENEISEVKSKNYPTALRGFDYLAKFIEGTAGTSTTEKSRAIIEPILDELAGPADEQYAKKVADAATKAAKKGKPLKKMPKRGE